MDFTNLILLSDNAIKNNKFTQAIKFLEDAIKIKPNAYDLHLKLGLLHQHLNDYEKSIQYFEKSISLEPKSVSAYFNLGLIYFKLNKKNLALKNYLKAIDLDPKNFLVSYNLGNYYFSNDDTENSEKYYLKSIEINPNHFYPYNNLFQLYDRSNNLIKLEETIKKVINIFGRIPLAQFLEGIFEFRKKNYNKTIEIFKNLEVDKNDVQRNSLKENFLAKSYDFIGSYAQAFEHFSESNSIVQNSLKLNSNKNKFVDLTKKRLSLNFDSLINLQPKSEEIDNFEDPVFLIGFPRSGTTLLDTILRTHKSIKVIEEKSLVDELINYLNKNTGGDILKLTTIEENFIKKLRNFYFERRKAFVSYENNKIFIDKMPLNIFYIPELKKIFPNSKFIMAKRNPCDVVLSCFMQPFIPNDAMNNFFNLEDTAEFYDLVMKLWKKYCEIFNLKFHTIKYEDVVNNFDYTLKNLINFLELEWSDHLRNFYLTASKRGIIHTPSYTQVNMPLYSNSIGRWKNYSKQFSSVNPILSKWMKIFGY